MKAPPLLQTLIDEGLIDFVLRQLMSGKVKNMRQARAIYGLIDLPPL